MCGAAQESPSEQADMILQTGERLILVLGPAAKRLRLYRIARLAVVGAPFVALAATLCFRRWESGRGGGAPSCKCTGLGA